MCTKFPAKRSAGGEEKRVAVKDVCCDIVVKVCTAAV